MKMQPNQQEQEYKETELGWLPEDWEVTNIGEVCDVSGGGTPSTTKKIYWTHGDIPWIKSGQCQDCYVNKAEQFITKEGLENCSAKMLKQNTVLVAMVGATVGKTGFLTFSACSNQNVAGLFPKGITGLDSLFLFFCLQSRYNEFTKTKGFIIANLSFIRNLKIPIPSLAEQQRIALVLSTIMEAELKSENVIGSLKELKKSLMKHLFTYGPVSLLDVGKIDLKETEIGLIPKSWDTKLIGDVAVSSQYGLSKRAGNIGKYPMLRMNNIVNGSLDLKDLKYLVLEETEFNKYKLSKGDVLFNRTNSFELVGKTSLFNMDGNYTFGSYLVRLVLKGDVILPEFLTLYLNWDKAQNRLKSLAIKAVGQSNISASRLKTFKIPIPPLAEQRQIASFLLAVDAKIKTEKARKKAIDGLFNSLLSNLMTAKIRVNNMEA